MNNPQVVDIGEILPEDFDRSGMCSSEGYFKFEERAIAWLKAHGWKFPQPQPFVRYGEEDGKQRLYTWRGNGDQFITTDGDAFGPLVRMLLGAWRPDGIIVDICHG